MGDTDNGDLLVWRETGLGRIRLNRPKALNSLTLDMVQRMARTLEDFASDPAIKAVLVDGAGERGLCAGGDIRALYESGQRHDGMADIFWAEEYKLNARIAAYPKPYIAFMDGITMGGGVGISAHGSHRVVTERTRLAMPETGIGFFPDIGGTWLLPRAPGEVGTYLGLTGATIGGADAIFAGFADRLVSAADLPAIAARLAAGHRIDAVLADFAQPVVPNLAAQRALIDTTMRFDTVPEIIAALHEEKSNFARTTAGIIAEKSPTSLVLTLAMLRLGRASASLAECLERELFAAARIMQGPDFYEGVRAAVIDKDRNPRWNPARLADVDETSLQSFFS